MERAVLLLDIASSPACSVTIAPTASRQRPLPHLLPALLSFLVHSTALIDRRSDHNGQWTLPAAAVRLLHPLRV